MVARVYPRVCGGTFAGRRVGYCLRGLSPRVRGNRWRMSRRRLTRRSIPACAGEPQFPPRPAASHSVYPRVCGGTAAKFSPTSAVRGLSPRVRGNPAQYRSWMNPDRSIPACAGEPTLCDRVDALREVYPRVCGGTPLYPINQGYMSGLSPRVRGNLNHSATAKCRRRSIPACAGEPQRHLRRFYGSGGLSPRVRGNPGESQAAAAAVGSIPACAGEPGTNRPPCQPSEVYPRVCGGTNHRNRQPASSRGLSPRVRGNPKLRICTKSCSWSIPACAGEPMDSPRRPLPPEVYPRVCGGTLPR